MLFQPSTWELIKFVLGLLSIFFMFVISYCAVRLMEIRRKEHHHLDHEIAEYAHHQREKERKAASEASTKNERWRSVITHLASNNINDWKLAIIEADAMLDSLLTQLGFEGESMGEKLKKVTKERFRNLDMAWEAHTFRNKIAHQGSEFGFSHVEAKRIVTLYEHMFRDYGYI